MTTNVPQYPLSRDDRVKPDPDAPASTVPNSPPAEAAAQPAQEQDLESQLQFANEVRAERLDMLWKLTLFVVFMALWILVVMNGGREMVLLHLIVPTVMISLGCLLTWQLLEHEKLIPAVWSFALGGVVSAAYVTTFGGHFAEHYVPFVFPLLTFVLGLLLPARDTLILFVVVVLAALGVPIMAEQELVLTDATAFALILTAIATGLSAQVSGELYSIAEWALDNYRKERQTTYALFESREALQKSFLRQQALTLELQKTNQELEDARHAAEEAKRFRGQFLANMSHELRTPLNAIIGFSQTMLDFPAMYDGVELPPQYHQDMTQILGSGKHLLSIINDILDLSKVDAGKLDLEIQPVTLDPVVKGVMSTAVGLVGDKKERVKLLKDMPDPMPMVMGDPLRVRQVLLNLFSNAAKFTDAGHIKLVVRPEGDEVIFGIEDTGIGIADADKATIFEEFRQGTAGRKKGRQGAGLGLAISVQLLRLMKGRMWFESTLGKGTTFYIALPLYVPPVDDAPEAAPVATHMPDAARTPVNEAAPVTDASK